MALSCLSGLLIIGIIVRQVQQRAILATPDAYAELDQLFFERSSEGAGTAAGATETTSAAPASGSEPDGNQRERERETARADLSASTRSSTPAPAREPPAASSAPGNAGASETLRIDVNRAGAAELEQLPRIGPKTAERILAFRAAYGAFRSVDDLQQVKGIGPKTLERLRPHIYVGAPPSSDDSSSGDSSGG